MGQSKTLGKNPTPSVGVVPYSNENYRHAEKVSDISGFLRQDIIYPLAYQS